MTVELISFTENGGRLAAALAAGLERSGHRAACTRKGERAEEWTAAAFRRAEALIFVGAAGIAVRSVAPHLVSKARDPAVVVVDELGRFAVPILSGHLGGANDLAREIAGLLGGQAVLTTATDARGIFAFDQWARRLGCAIPDPEKIRPVASRMLAGGTAAFWSQWPVAGECPSGVVPAGQEAAQVKLTIRDTPEPALKLVPRIVWAGIGVPAGRPGGTAGGGPLLRAGGGGAPSSRSGGGVHHRPQGGGARPAGAVPPAPAAPAHLFSGGAEPGGGGVYPLPLRPSGHRDGQRMRAGGGAGQRRPAAAEKDSGGGGDGGAGRRPLCPGMGGSAMNVLYVVGLGPGGSRWMTWEARAALEQAEVLCGYTVYLDLIRGEFPDKEYFSTPMTQEIERCRAALERARSGRTTALVCSGDAGVYGMAGPVLELAPQFPEVEIQVVPGVTAALAGAAVLGAPLMHDFAVLSLSDLLTPWEVIRRRLELAAQGDFVLCLYNPSSRRRRDHLRMACDIVLAHRGPETVCGWVRNAGRAQEEHQVLTLGELQEAQVDMFTTVFIGSAATRRIGDRMVTPRGYEL